MKHLLIVTAITATSLLTASQAQAQVPVLEVLPTEIIQVIVTPVEEVVPVEVIQADLEQRREIRSLPITQRPNRTVHVYGNFVRWRHRTGRSLLYGNR